MSKASKQEPDDELLPEYDFSSMKGAVRGKYYERYRGGVNLALLEPEVAKAFPSDRAVNEALRTVMRATKAPRRRRSAAKNGSLRTKGTKAKRHAPRG